MDFGIARFVKSGVRFAFDKSSATFVGLKLLASPATSYTIALPIAPPPSQQAVTMDATGQLAFQALGGGGSVTSVSLSAPSDFAVTGSPVTGAGTLTFAYASQAQNTVLSGPVASNGTPTYRLLQVADIPLLTAAKISNFDTQVRTSRLDQLAVPTASVNFNSQKITGLADPTNAQDAVTKLYVDTVAQGLNAKQSCRAASTANVTIATPGTAIDGVTLANTNRVLLKNQATQSENGIYIFNGSGSAMTRALDMDTAIEFPSAFVFTEEGTLNADTGWTCVTNAPITVGTTAIVFTQFSGAGSFVDGNGLVKTGNQLDVVGTLNRILANSDSIDISPNYVGQSSITTLGTISAGVWNGTAIPVGSGGTGAITAAGARTALGASGIFRQSFTNANLTSGLLTVTHNLGQQFVQVQVSDENNKIIVTPDDITLTSATVATIDLTSFGTISGTWNCTIVG